MVPSLLLAIVFAASTIFSFVWFYRTNPGLRLWWLKTPTSHALFAGTLAFVFLALEINASPFYQFAGILLVATGLGYVVFGFFFPKMLSFPPTTTQPLKGLVFFIHLAAGVAGNFIFLQGFSSLPTLILPLSLATAYLLVVGTMFIKK